MAEVVEKKASAIGKIVKDAVTAARARADAATKANAAAAKSGGFKSGALGEGVIEKMIRSEIDARRDELVEAAINEALASW